MLSEHNLALGTKRAAADTAPIEIGHQKHGCAVGVSTADALGGDHAVDALGAPPPQREPGSAPPPQLEPKVEGEAQGKGRAGRCVGVLLNVWAALQQPRSWRMAGCCVPCSQKYWWWSQLHRRGLCAPGYKRLCCHFSVFCVPRLLLTCRLRLCRSIPPQLRRHWRWTTSWASFIFHSADTFATLHMKVATKTKEVRQESLAEEERFIPFKAWLERCVWPQV